jgi:hypothetical protein
VQVFLTRPTPSWSDLFESPLGRNKATSTKIISLAFHIFTLFIPLLFFKFFPCISIKKKPIQLIQINLDAFPTLSKTGLLAFSLVNEELKKNPSLQSKDFGSHQGKKVRGPKNQTILYLCTLFDQAKEKYLSLLKKQGTTPWSNPTVIRSENTLMALGFAITTLTFKEFAASVTTLRPDESVLDLLANKTNYFASTLFTCLNTYHNLRSELEYDTRHKRFQYNSVLDTSEFFFDADMEQHNWNTLYNECLDRMKEGLSAKNWKILSQYKKHATQKDLSHKPYTPLSGPAQI